MGLATRPDIISFAGGMPGNELFPVQEIDEIYNALPLDIKQTAFQYRSNVGVSPAPRIPERIFTEERIAG